MNKDNMHTLLSEWPSGFVKIYAAGRIGPVDSGGDWRNDIVLNPYDRFSPKNDDLREDFYSSVRAVPTVHDSAIYVGPYAFDNWDPSHCPGHFGKDEVKENGWFYFEGDTPLGDEIEDRQVRLSMERDNVSQNSKRAIEAADIVLAVIDRDSYGTLIEVGYALALGKRVLAVVDDDPELWFALFSINWSGHPIHSRTYASVKDMLDDLWYQVDCMTYDGTMQGALYQLINMAKSPLETEFAEAHMKYATRTWNWYPALQCQYPIPGTKYRADFAEPELKAIIELDGHTYHSSKDAFNNDRKRQRTLEKLGWRVIRFTGDEVRGNAYKCVQEAYEFLDQLAASKA